jgi:hypothetical protein
MMPVSSVWAGPEMNRHLNAPPLMMTETRGSTPFRLDLHVGDVGHTLVVGPTGAGKSVLLSLLALQFRRFIGAQVVLFVRCPSRARPPPLHGQHQQGPVHGEGAARKATLRLAWRCGHWASDRRRQGPDRRSTARPLGQVPRGARRAMIPFVLASVLLAALVALAVLIVLEL